MHFDVIVVGAGHAGVEAAHAAARMGCHVGLCTLSRETVAHMPCNPAVGGTAKGHLVREIDALGGVMGKAIDATGIQFKLLNRSRGPAVWSPRAQADKRRYGAWVAGALERESNITWIVGKAGRILVEQGRAAGLAMEDGESHSAGAVLVTTGTFLNGLVHVGPEQRPAGRHGEPPSRELAESIRSCGFEIDAAAIEPWRSARLQPAHLEALRADRLSQVRGRRLSVPPRRPLLRSNVNQAVEKRARRHDDSAGVMGIAVFHREAHRPAILDQQAARLAEQPRHIGFVLEDVEDPGTIATLVRLRPGRPDRRAAAAIEKLELDARRVDGAAHQAAKRVDLPNEMSLGSAADRRIAGHVRDGVARQST